MESEQHLLNLSTLELVNIIQGLKDDLEMYREYLDREKNRSELLSRMVKQKEAVINEFDGCLKWHIEVNERYEKALEEIAKETGTPYAEIAEKALNE